MNPVDAMLLAIAAILVAYLLMVLMLKAIRPALRVGTQVRDTFTAPFSSHFGESHQDARFRELENEVRRVLGMDEVSESQERADVVQAAVAAQYVTVLNQHLRKTVTQCLHTHWAVAQGLGAIDMADAARHRWPSRLRRRVIDLSELLSQHLERYPLLLDAPELIRLQLGLRWVAPSCTTCPYFTSTVADAPRICPTAKAMGHRPAGTARPRVIDGVVLDDCEEGTR